jgi:IclR family KDG regulon transcriptional repressor
MSLDEVSGILRKQGMKALTPNTITTFKEFVLALEFVHLHGYGVDEDECEIGASCLAAPVTDHRGKILASLSGLGASVRLGRERRPELISQLLRISRELSERLGCRPDEFLITSSSSI